MTDSNQIEHTTAQSEAVEAVVIAASVGGPPAIEAILSELPGKNPWTLFIVQHFSSHFSRPFAQRLNRKLDLSIQEGEDQKRVEEGEVYVAPGGAHMKVQPCGNSSGNQIKIIDSHDGKQMSRPSANVLMESVAEVYGKNTVGIVLTGMGNDGTEGLRKMKEEGGKTIAEHQQTCRIFGMPRSAIEAGVVDLVLPLDEIAQQLQEWT